MSQELKSRLLKTILGAGSAGVGGGLVYVLYELSKAKPEQVLALLSNWGPLSIFGVVGMVLLHSGGGKLVSAIVTNATAQQQLADAVQSIARRDDNAARERELLLNVVASKQKDMQNDLAEIKALLAAQPRARAAAGGAN